MKPITLDQSLLIKIKNAATINYQTLPNNDPDNFLCKCYTLAVAEVLKIDLDVKERVLVEPLD